MRYALINSTTNTWEYESDDLAEILTQHGREAVNTILVKILVDEPDGDRETHDGLAVELAVQHLINTANANPEPLHYKVREAIDQLREAIR